jgi:hypothetical protein
MIMNNETSHTLRQLSSKDFASFGVNDLAYLKPVIVNGVAGFAIHAADGTPLTVVNDVAVAGATVRQHDMEPLSLH